MTSTSMNHAVIIILHNEIDNANYPAQGVKNEVIYQSMHPFPFEPKYEKHDENSDKFATGINVNNLLSQTNNATFFSFVKYKSTKERGRAFSLEGFVDSNCAKVNINGKEVY